MGWFDKKEKADDTSTATAAPPTANTNMNLAEVEEYDVVADDLRQSIAKMKGRTTVAKAVKVAVSVLYPISAAKEAARKKAEEEALKNPEPGRLTPQGIYLGQYAPKDRSGKSLGKVFNVFAAPQDLPDLMTYADTVEYISRLKNWNGFDGTNYATDKEIYAALKDGSYKGGWIIPTRELLVGTRPDGESGVRKGKVIQPDNLFDHQNNGAFKGTFKTAAASGSVFPGWYWSSTENRDYPYGVWDVRFSDGCGDWVLKNTNRLSCRPMRLVPVNTP